MREGFSLSSAPEAGHGVNGVRPDKHRDSWQLNYGGAGGIPPSNKQ